MNALSVAKSQIVKSFCKDENEKYFSKAKDHQIIIIRMKNKLTKYKE
jgi:hypothetical protein